MLPAAIPLQSASNLRDLGQWPTQDGRRVRQGVIYRAPALTGLCAQDEATIATLGVRTVCDLRGDDECRLHPVAITGATRHALPIAPWAGPSLAALLATGRADSMNSAASLMHVMHQAYRTYATIHAPQFRTLFQLLLDRQNLPLLIHCSAGKDRTGFAAALLLTALGVAWQHVVEDYLATNRLWRRELAGSLSLPDDVKEVLLGAHEALLTSAFNALRETHGSLDDYLAGPIGLSPDARRQLEDILLE